jgi:Bacterial proteasome activator
MAPAAAGRGPSPQVTVRVPARPVIILGGPAGSPQACRVDEPGRLMRVWALLSAAGQELHQVEPPPPAALARLRQQIRTVAAELKRSLSPELGDELDRLVPPGGTGPGTQEELRIEYAGLLGWTDGLVVAMLDQLERRDPSAIGAAAPP